MKKLLIILAFTLTTLHSTMAQTNIVDQVVWVVGKEPILLSDVEEARLALEMEGVNMEDPYCRLPEDLAVQKLWMHQAELDSIDVDEARIIQEANERLNNEVQRIGSKENLEILYHRTYQQMREMLKEQLRTGMLVEGAQGNLTRGIKVTPAEVRDYYSRMNQDSIPMIPTKVEVQIITSRPKVTREEVERVENKLKEIARRVNAGETTFSIQARMWSQDKGTANQGGECGMTGRNTFVPEFANVAFSLTDPKKVSKIVKTEYGYHIIQLIEKKGDMANVRHILIKPEISDSSYTASLARLDSIAEDIRNNKFTFEEGAQKLSEDKDTRSNQGLMFVRDMYGRPTTPRFEMKELPQEIALVVDTMKVGEISKAIRYTNEKGQEITAIVKLKNRIESHRANPVEDFQVIRDIVYAERAQKMMNDWIVNKIKNTYVRISPEWKGCKFKYDGWLR